MSAQTTNPFGERLETLEKLWIDFKDKPEKHICHWLFQAEEVWVLDLFLDGQNGGHAASHDVFVALRSPTHRPETYINQLVTEFNAFLNINQTWLTTKGIRIDKRPGPHESNANQLPHFIKTINFLARELEQLSAKNLVLCLLPQSDPESISIVRFLTFLNQNSLQSNIKVLVTDDAEKERLKSLSRHFPQRVHTQALNLQLKNIIGHFSHSGLPDTPEVRFNQSYAELMTALPNETLTRIEELASKCLTVCEQENWLPLKGAIQLAVAHAYVQANQLKKAHQQYTTVIFEMEKAFMNGNQQAGKISIAAWLGVAPVNWQLRQQQQTIDAYQQAAQRASFFQEWFYAIESHRGLTQLYKKLSQERLGEKHYQQLFAIATKLSPDNRQLARLPEIGKTYWQQQPTPQDRLRADELLHNLLGPDWRLKH